MAYLVAVLVGVVLGGADRVLGAVPHWGVPASLTSAPWLILPFIFGCSQQKAERAAKVGLVVTLAALAGYILMIWGHYEAPNPDFTLSDLPRLVALNLPYIVGGLVTGPLYGYLGQRWRTQRAWVSALSVAGALVFEPVVKGAVVFLLGVRPGPHGPRFGFHGGFHPGFHFGFGGAVMVSVIELAVGVLVGLYFLGAGLRARHRQVSPRRSSPQEAPTFAPPPRSSTREAL